MDKMVITNKSKSLLHSIIGIKAGWRHELDGKRGITHFLEHAIFLGNKVHPSPDNEFNVYGVEVNGITLPEYTLFYFTSTQRDFGVILRIFLSLIFNPEFNKDKVENEKMQNIITAMVKESDYNPWELAQEWAENLIFNRNFMLSLGTEKDIESLVDKDIQVWHQNYYHRLNSFIAIYGNIQDNEITRLIEDAKIRPSGGIPLPAEVNWCKNENYVVREGMKNVEMVYGFRLPEYNIAWDILTIILGNYPISKLSEGNIKNHAYMVSSNLKWTTDYGGFFLYFGATSSKDASKIDDRIFYLLENFDMNEKELESAKKIRTLQILKLKESGESGLYRYLLQYPLEKFVSFEEKIKEIDGVTKEDIVDLVGRLLNRDNSVKSLVGSGKSAKADSPVL